MSSPLLFGGNNTSKNLQNAIQMANGSLIRSDGPKNYIKYATFENGLTTGWSLANTTLSSGVPNQVSASWGAASGNLTLSATATNPLTGTYSCSVASSAATTAGDMLVSDVLSIDIADQAKVLAFNFYYQASVNPANGNFSGTASNTFQIWIYDVTNSAWIQPAGVYNMVQSSGVGIASGTWQTPYNMTQFRIAIICINASANAITMLYDAFFCGPQSVSSGYAGSDWVAYTPTITGFGSYTGAFAFSRRVGDTLEVQIGFITGTPTATQAQVTLGYNGGNANVTIDTSKITTGSMVGKMGQSQFNANYFSTGVLVPGATNYLTFGVQTSGSTELTAINGNNLAAPSSAISFFAKVPILGWSSNTVQSQDTDTRVVAFSGTTSTTTLSSGDNQLSITSINDTHGAVSGNSYVVPISGNYSIDLDVTAYNGTLKDLGAFIKIAGVATQSKTQSAQYWRSSSTNIERYLTAGTAITFWANGNDNYTSVTADMSVKRFSGPATIQASESVSVRYKTAVALSISNDSNAHSLDFATKDWDSHGAVTGTGSGVDGTWKFTAPISGEYLVSTAILYDNLAWAASNFTDYRIYKNGSQYSILDRKQLESGSGAIYIHLSGTGTVKLLAGEYIDIRSANNRTAGAATLITADTFNWVEIKRTGNY